MELMDLGKVMRDAVLIGAVVRQRLSFTPSINAVNLMGVCVAKDGAKLGEIECDIVNRRITKDIAGETGETETVLEFIRKQLLENGDAFAGAASRRGEDKKLFTLYCAAGIKASSSKPGLPIYN